MSNLVTRAGTAIVFVGVVLAGVYFSVYSYLLLFLIVSSCCVWEFYNITKINRETPERLFKVSRAYALFLGISVFISTYLMAIGEIPMYWLVTYPPAMLGFFIIELYGRSPRPLENMGLNVASQILIVLPLAMLNFAVFIDGEYKNMVMMGMLFLVWVQDSGAYVFGSSFGKRPLFKRISPNKTIEGFLGGALTVLGVAVAIYYVLDTLTLKDWLIMAGLTIVFATLGDLIESMIKRSLNIKDSGTFLPGHGGFLDRFDALLFAIPSYAAYIVLVYGWH